MMLEGRIGTGARTDALTFPTNHHGSQSVCLCVCALCTQTLLLLAGVCNGVERRKGHLFTEQLKVTRQGQSLEEV